MHSSAALTWIGAAFGFSVLVVGWFQLRAISAATARNQRVATAVDRHATKLLQIYDSIIASNNSVLAGIRKANEEHLAGVATLLGIRPSTGQFKDLNNQLQCKIRPLRPQRPERVEIESPPEDPQPC